MYCTKCGKQLEEGVNFCTNCGEKIHRQVEASTSNTEKNYETQENQNNVLHPESQNQMDRTDLVDQILRQTEVQSTDFEQVRQALQQNEIHPVDTTRQSAQQSDVWQSGNQPQQPQLSSGMDIGMKIIALICAAIHGFSGIIGVLAVFTALIGFFNYFQYSFFGASIGLVDAVVALVLNVLLCGIAILIAFKRTKENTDGFILCFLIGVVIRFVTLLVFSLIGNSRYMVSTTAIGIPIIILLIEVIAMVLFSVLLGHIPIIGKTQEQMKSDLEAVMKTVQEIGDSRGGRQVNQQQNNNGTPSMGNGNIQNTQTTTVPPKMAGIPLKTNRGLIKSYLLAIITCGIYGFYFFYAWARDVNKACAGDGKKTTGLLLLLVFTFLTCGIYYIYWEYALGERLSENAKRYGIEIKEDGLTVFLWTVVGFVFCGIGLFVSTYILMKNTNKICMDYNQYNNL